MLLRTLGRPFFGMGRPREPFSRWKKLSIERERIADNPGAPHSLLDLLENLIDIRDFYRDVLIQTEEREKALKAELEALKAELEALKAVIHADRSG